MKKIYLFCIVAIIALFGSQVVKSEGESQDSLYDKMAESSKNLSDSDYRPWLLRDMTWGVSETGAKFGAATMGFGAGMLAAVSTGGIWPFIAGPLAGYLSYSFLYGFTPAGKYSAAVKTFKTVFKEMQGNSRTRDKSLDGIDDPRDPAVKAYVLHHFSNTKYPLVEAHAYFKSFADRLFKAQRLLEKCLERAEQGSKLADDAADQKEAINDILPLIKAKMKLFVDSPGYLKQLENFHNDSAAMADQQRRAEEKEREQRLIAHERAQDRALAAQAGNIQYQARHINK